MEHIEKLTKGMCQLHSNIDLEILKLAEESGISYESIKKQLMEKMNQVVEEDLEETHFKFVERNKENIVVGRSHENLKSDLDVTKHVAKLLQSKEVTKVEVYVMAYHKKNFTLYRTFGASIYD
ncbi:hypothetical protein P9X10_00950 [Bacillus cereus]|nr:hypothetical protein [Bacillus cereus]